jgi:hypothetical protein
VERAMKDKNEAKERDVILVKEKDEAKKMAQKTQENI